MAIINIQITEVKQSNPNNITFTARQNNHIITREISSGTFSSWEQFAQWIINQEPDWTLLPDKEKTLAITFHLDPDGYRVVDGVIVT